MFCTDKLSPYPHLKLLGKYVTCEKAACVCMCVCVGCKGRDSCISSGAKTKEPKVRETGDKEARKL